VNQAGDHELRNHAEFQQVLGHHLAEDVAGVGVLFLGNVGREAERFLADPLFDDVIESSECATHDEEHVGGVDLNELLMRVLAAALRRNRCRRAFEDLEQRLLHALTGDVARDRWVLTLAGDLVDLVNVDDAGFGLLDVVVRCLDQLQEDVFDILTDVSSLSQCSCIRNGNRDIDHASQCLRQQGLSGAGRP
jgi:hypothetical protein